MVNQSLVADLAKLLVKHGLDEFRELTEALKHSDFLDTLTKTVAELERRGVTTRPKADIRQMRPKSRSGAGTSRRARSPMELLADRDPEAAGYLRELERSLVTREALRSAADLRAFAVGLGLKTALPNDRRTSVRRIINAMAELPPDRLTQVRREEHRFSSAPRESDYREWAETIMGTWRDQDDSKPARGAAQHRGEESDRPAVASRTRRAGHTTDDVVEVDPHPAERLPDSH